jgi:hypothetical protein
MKDGHTRACRRLGRGHGRSDLGSNIPSKWLLILPRVMTIHYCRTLLVVLCVMASNRRAVMVVKY